MSKKEVAIKMYFEKQLFLLFLVNGARKNAPGKSAPQENCPPPLPLKKYLVKLLHVMEYLSGENFINFNFRQA